MIEVTMGSRTSTVQRWGKVRRWGKESLKGMRVRSESREIKGLSSLSDKEVISWWPFV
jgi:hypothetical protein